MFNPNPNCFTWSVDNFGSTYSDTGFAINSPGHASANTKGANTSMLVGIAEDCYGMAICFSGGHASATIRRQLTDILIDPAAGIGGTGSSWSVLIPNLYSCSANLGCGGYWYYFPIYLKAGTAIGSAHQDLAASTVALRVGIRIYGKPSRPDLLRVGTKVEAFGVTLASTSGTAITPGTQAMGAYTASLGTTANHLFWWQGGFGYNDTTLGGGTSVAESTWLDVAVSTDAGTTKQVAARNIIAQFSTTEQGGKTAFGSCLPLHETPAGATVYMRGVCSITPQTTPTVVAYGLGG